VSLIFVVIALVGVAVMFFAMTTLLRGGTDSARSSKTATGFAAASAALEQFAGTSGRLPCPADPTANTGDAIPNTGAAACSFPMGTIPWKTIGMRSDDALDAWGWKISYRVYSGPTGLTQEGGASMVDCDTNNGATPTPPSIAPGGLCGLLHNHTDAQFLAGKGLRGNDFGTARSDVGYVLISHGPSGMGAYTSTGVRKPMPTSVDELANINTTDAAGQFIAKAAVTHNVATGAPLAIDATTYFDDILSFQSVSDIVKHANLSARDWPEVADNAITKFTMDAATINPVIPGSVSPNTNTGRDDITFGSGSTSARVRGFDADGNQDITYNTVGGASGLGINGNGSLLLSSTNSERIRIDFGQSAQRFAVALGDFGTYVASGVTYTEQVEFRFRGGLINVNIVKSACRADGGVATFSIDPGTDFTRVDIRPQAALPSAFGITSLTVADFKTCAAGTQECLSTLATAANRCP
jgi:hypothetical protein